MSPLQSHIQEMQDKASTLSTLIQALHVVTDSGRGEAAIPALLSLAERLAGELNAGLDLSTLPEVPA